MVFSISEVDFLVPLFHVGLLEKIQLSRVLVPLETGVKTQSKQYFTAVFVFVSAEKCFRIVLSSSERLRDASLTSNSDLFASCHSMFHTIVFWN